MTWNKLQINHVKSFCFFDVSKDDKLKEAFSWKNTQPLLKHNHQHRGTKFNFLDYQLQYKKADQFLILKDQ